MKERTTTWDAIGVSNITTDYMDLLESADLNYDIVLRDCFTEYEGNKLLVPNRKVVLREDTEEVFGIVSDRYQVCQNRDAFNFIESIPDIELIKAGNIDSLVYLIGRLPEVTILGDSIQPHIIFQNSHDGSCSIRSTICMLRIICQNQFVGTFRESPATISIRHNGDINSKLEVARVTLNNIYTYLENYDLFAHDMVTQKVTPNEFNKIVETYFQISDEAPQYVIDRVLEDRYSFKEIYDAEDNQNFKGTKWGIINAFSDFITHKEPIRKTKNSQFNKFFGSLDTRPLDEFMSLVSEV